MRGDLGLCRQIEQNNLVRGSVEGGEAIRQALLQPVEYREDGESTRVKESSAREALASLIGGEREVETPSGFIDKPSDAVIEVKYHNRWKDGLGQVLAYQSHYPRLARRLHLFAHIGDKDTDKYFEMAKSVCYAHAVKVTFEKVGVEEPALDLDDDDASTVVGDNRARIENEWVVRKRVAEETDKGRLPI
ncbi:FirrV-1-A34 [Ectocarpus siliculosus]|uniref:FirrV-1-A34 n=1 Tax=Ectocarpus siliculosus TaxID=2880 RepID=D8LFH9_ECTSI|nr:FirrV-1-A34 [Ectocarpus siliculosus]|eukprot:CBN79899.1 FirrV-1-A34 [Ectocarpus siliculosus]